MSAIDEVPAAGHERRDVRASTVVKWGAGVFALVIFTAATMWLLLLRLQAREERVSEPASPLASYGPREPPQPRLQTHPYKDIEKLRERERAQLEGYGWVDRDAGTVHIPVERAMSLLAQRSGEGKP